MAIVTPTRLRQTLSTSLAMYSPTLQDLVHNSNVVSGILKEKGALKPYYGAEIRVPLIIDKLRAQWFTGYDKLQNSPRELVNSAVFTPKNVAVGWTITGTEELANKGKAEIHNLVKIYMQSAQDSMMDAWETALHADGTGMGGREMIGLGGALPIVPNAGVYGGIDRSSVSIWQTSTFNATKDFPDIGTTWDSTTCRMMLERVVANRSKGKRHATIAIADIKSYQAVSAACTAIQRIVDSRTAILGFDGLQIATPAGPITVMCANGVNTVMPENTIYGLDLEGLSIYYHPDRNFVPLFEGDGLRPINQDATAQYLVWNGELVMENPRYQWRLVTA